MTTTITLRQAELLLAFFGGHDAEVTVAAESPGLSPGLYAWLTEYPDEGSQYLGPTEVDDELADKGRPLTDAGFIGKIVASTGEFGYQVVQWADHYRPRIGDRLALNVSARTDEAALTLAVDAAMVEMRNIHPPLRRSDCMRLIRAALEFTQVLGEAGDVVPKLGKDRP